jgi:hypothetical protein
MDENRLGDTPNPSELRTTDRNRSDDRINFGRGARQGAPLDPGADQRAVGKELLRTSLTLIYFKQHATPGHLPRITALISQRLITYRRYSKKPKPYPRCGIQIGHLQIWWLSHRHNSSMRFSQTELSLKIGRIPFGYSEQTGNGGTPLSNLQELDLWYH